MGNKQSIKVIGPADLIERNPFVEINLAALMREYSALMGMMPIKRVGCITKAEYEYSSEPMTKLSKESSSLNWKSAFYAVQYGLAPKKLDEKLNLAAIASGSTSGGTLPKGNQNGKQSKRK